MEIHHDPDARVFFAEVEGGRAHLLYDHVDAQTLDYRSTFVPPAARKRGVGLELVEHALKWAEREGKTVIPSCWFVKDVMDARS